MDAKLDEESRRHGDILKEGFVDTYQNLTLKSMFMLKFAHTQLVDKKTQWVLKVDDDCYVDIRVLLHYTRTIRKSGYGAIIGKVLELCTSGHFPHSIFFGSGIEVGN